MQKEQVAIDWSCADCTAAPASPPVIADVSATPASPPVIEGRMHQAASAAVYPDDATTEAGLCCGLPGSQQTTTA